jgi:hypothetical protein
MRKPVLEERHALIDILCRIPNIGIPSERQCLLSTLPNDLQSNIPYHEATKPHITNIINMVLDDNWFQLSDTSYSLMIVIQNARNKVKNSPLDKELQEVLHLLSDAPLLLSHRQEREKQQPSTNHPFKQKLDSITIAVKELIAEILPISVAFSQHILQHRCVAASKRLEEKSSFVKTYLEVLQESSKMPPDIISERIWIIRELIDCSQQIHLVKTSIDEFCIAYGASIHQPVEKRHDIQRHLEKLSQCCNSVLKAVEDMYASLAENNSSDIDHTATG